MFGIILVTHGKLAQEFALALEHIVGKQAQLAAINIMADDDMEKKRGEILDAITSTDTGEGVVILTDMFGGTPSNLAISTMKPKSVDVIAGLNLPMLVKLAALRTQLPMAKAVLEAQEAGRKYISVASNLLDTGA
jgi:PTS system mannose-specific IIA component